MAKEREIVLVRLRDEEQRKEVTGKEKNLKDRKERIIKDRTWKEKKMEIKRNNKERGGTEFESDMER